MANHASSRKRIRRNATRANINGQRMSRIRTLIKQVDFAISEGNAKQAEEALLSVQPELDRGVAKGILPRQTASRKLSRLSRKIHGLKAAS